ncbi:hypothetical protein MJN51_35240, partial [Salmonella enterica subsp. enterica serovar Kentucky]|nr:hypothetical protein [Salmonella enterica subsp. enterica serovar Kentucky]
PLIDVQTRYWFNPAAISQHFIIPGAVTIIMTVIGAILTSLVVVHLRGYRDRTGLAPIKETLAAAIVMRSGWQPGTPLLDPMCGSG